MAASPTPANLNLRRAQLILILWVLVPTILATPLGIVLLVAGGSTALSIVTGILVLAFCASSVAGYVIGSIYLRRGASMVEIQSDFMSAVSHDLRTPLTSMRMFVDALLDERLSDPAERQLCLTNLRREIVRLDELVGRLLELIRIEGSKMPYERVPVEVDKLVQDSLAALDAGRFGARPQVERAVTPGLQVLGDGPALTQVLVNLLTNARRHGGSEAPIELSARRLADHEVELAVRDRGPGIPIEDQKRIFEMFERGQTAFVAETDGSGLGLAIVKAIVTGLGGRIELQSPTDGGTRFCVFLPCPPGGRD